MGANYRTRGMRAWDPVPDQLHQAGPPVSKSMHLACTVLGIPRITTSDHYDPNERATAKRPRYSCNQDSLDSIVSCPLLVPNVSLSPLAKHPYRAGDMQLVAYYDPSQETGGSAS
ncbi:hypothetical protein CHU98_g426 [Xylaria longipes]|nr:hypothetical protein CHU98_g426 [Xylaria longipes]